MQISLKWINELVNIETIPIDDLIDKLTLGGFEVEEILEVEINQEKQLVLEISATANRSDSLSIQGISAEITALLDQTPKISTYAANSFDWKQKIETLSAIDSENDLSISTDFSIAENTQNKNYCSTFLAVVVENLTDTTTPQWIKEKLISSGIVPVNNLLDLQNYILLETGYPFAFYDFEKLSTKLDDSKFSLSLETGKNTQNFHASNDLTYELDESNVLVKANNLPISIAGIIESKDVAYSESSNSLLIEGSIFTASNIRQQSRKLGLRTDRSARYEKSLKNTYLIESLYRLIALLRIKNPNLITKVHTIFKINEPILNSIVLRYKTIKEILGPIKKTNQTNFDYIQPEIVTNYLERLNFKFSYNQPELLWDVEIPYLRSDDITREIDLIEEIGRLHGFNNFLTTLPKIKTIGSEDLSYKTRKKVTSCLLNLGLNELIHYSLVNEITNNKIQLINPLLSDCSNLRTSLLPNLIETFKENLKQGNLSIEGFEYGHVFSGDIETSFTEREYVAGIFQMAKTKLEVSEMNNLFIWLEAKGKIEQLFKQLNLLTYWETRSFSTQDDIFHPYKSGNVYLINGKKLGTFGQLHPLLANRLGISETIYLFEFDMYMIQNQIQKNKLSMYKEYPLYPKIKKDLSFVIKQDVSFKKLQETLYLNGTQFLSEVNLLDEYRGQSIPENHTSLCLQFIFQSNKTTLQNKDIETIMANLQLILTNKFEAIIRN